MGMFDAPARPVAAAGPARSGRARAWRRPAAMAAAGVVLIALAAGTFWFTRISHAVTAPPSVAILPLRNTSSDPGKDYFADALTQELIAKLWKFGSVRVIAPTSSRAYRDVRDIADCGASPPTCASTPWSAAA